MPKLPDNMRGPDPALRDHARRMVALTHEELQRAAVLTVQGRLGSGYLERAALSYAAAKLAETGEHGTTDALTLLRQISDGIE